MCTPIDTRGIFALIWWYVLAYRTIYIRWFNKNLFRKPHLSSFWHTHARTHAIVKVYRDPRPCRIESGQIYDLNMKHACTCSTFHFNSLTRFAYEVIRHYFAVCWYLYHPQTLFVGGILFSRCPSVSASVHPSMRPSVTLCFLNNSKSHCWIFIKPCKLVHICKTNTLDKKVRARGQFY